MAVQSLQLDNREVISLHSEDSDHAAIYVEANKYRV